MTRNLTAEEAEILGDVVDDPASWWAHVQSVFDEPRAEAALANKIARHAPTYLASRAAAAPGKPYKNRAARESAAEEALAAASIRRGMPA